MSSNYEESTINTSFFVSFHPQHVDALEGKVRQLSEQLESQANLHQAAIRRAREAEGCFDDYKDRVRTLEGGLASSDALRDNLRTERQKVSFFALCSALLL